MAERRARRVKRPTRRPLRSRNRRLKSVPAEGPVTLAQARTLAKVPAPGSREAKVRLVATSPATVGLERRKLELRQEHERRKRIKEYKTTLAIMKKRGVKGLAPRTDKGARALKTAPKPLQVFAEGDSWFDYPVPGFGGGIIPRLEKKLGVPILNLAKAGDQVRYMLGVKERKVLIKQFIRGCPAGGPWDAMLFSGGGNDVVHDPMVLWIKDFNPNLPPAALIHQRRFDAALALVRAGYEDLIELRNSLSPNTPLFFHGYDFPLPDGRRICLLGPWLIPTFDLRGFPTLASRFAVTKVMLEHFAAMLRSLESRTVTVINSQGTLPPQESSWHNELHPSEGGFNTFARVFRDAVKAVFPNRVL